jgi:hypothetical protein
MSDSMRKILITTAFVIAAVAILPPWVYTFDHNGQFGGHSRKPAGYEFVWAPPAPERPDPGFGVVVDGQRVILELLATLGAAAIALLLSSGKPAEAGQIPSASSTDCNSAKQESSPKSKPQFLITRMLLWTVEDLGFNPDAFVKVLRVIVVLAIVAAVIRALLRA